MMKRNLISLMSRAALTAALLALTFSSCDDSFVYDTLPPCPQGVSLRFVYDYNMEYANAFPSQVDCLTLYVYDSEGNFVTSRTETTSVLADESWRMTLDLEAGDYHFVAYGGIACSEASFKVAEEPGRGTKLASLETYLPTDGGVSQQDLHNFFFGDLDMTVSANTDSYDEGTVKMMRNTNNVQILLQQMNGEPIYASDFEFSITDDNTRFDSENNIIPQGTTTYLPWSQGERTTGTRAGGDGKDVNIVVAYAELSTSRLFTGNSPRLLVHRANDGEKIIDIPLIDYLLLVKSDHYSEMGSQEFLDRQNEWVLLFFLDEGADWLRTYIVVNDWVVRVNDATF